MNKLKLIYILNIFPLGPLLKFSVFPICQFLPETLVGKSEVSRVCRQHPRWFRNRIRGKVQPEAEKKDSQC